MPGGIRGVSSQRVPRAPGPPTAVLCPPALGVDQASGTVFCSAPCVIFFPWKLESPRCCLHLRPRLCLRVHTESLAPAACHCLCLCGSHYFVSVSCHLYAGFFVVLPFPFPFPLKPASLCPLGLVRPFYSLEPSGEEPGLGTDRTRTMALPGLWPWVACLLAILLSLGFGLDTREGESPALSPGAPSPS